MRLLIRYIMKKTYTASKHALYPVFVHRELYWLIMNIFMLRL